MKLMVIIISSIIMLSNAIINLPSAHAMPIEPMPTIGTMAGGTLPSTGCNSTTSGCSVSFTGSVGSGWGRVDVSYGASAYGGISPYAGSGTAIGGEWLHYNATSADAINIYAFYIEPIDNVDNITSIPIDFSYSMWLTASASIDSNNQIVANSSATAKISVSDWLNNPWAGNIYSEFASIVGSGQSSYEKTDTKDLSLSVNKWYLVALDAYTFAQKNQWGGVPDGYYSSSSTADVDPTIVIDPTWQYADYFKIVQFSVEPPPQGVPEPSTISLIGSGLVGIILLERRKLKVLK